LLDTLPPDDPRAARSRRDLRRRQRLDAQPRHHGACLANKTGTVLRLNKSRNSRAAMEIFCCASRKKIKVETGFPPVRVAGRERDVARPAKKMCQPKTLAAFASIGWRAKAVVADVFDWPQIETRNCHRQLVSATTLKRRGCPNCWEKLPDAHGCSWPSNRTVLPARFYAAACFG